LRSVAAWTRLDESEELGILTLACLVNFLFFFRNALQAHLFFLMLRAGYVCMMELGLDDKNLLYSSLLSLDEETVLFGDFGGFSSILFILRIFFTSFGVRMRCSAELVWWWFDSLLDGGGG
jgi:hypothetical protein